MKTTIKLIMVLSLSIYFSACDKNMLKVTPSAEISTVNHAISNVSSFSVGDIFNVNISFSDNEESLMIEANANLHQLIKVEQFGGELRIGIKENSNISGPAVMNVYLSAKSLNSIKTGGVADVSLLDTLKGVNLDLDIRDASRLRGVVAVEDLTIDISGATKIDLSGSTTYCQVSGDGATQMAGFNFETNQLNASLHDACEISLTVNESLSVSGEGSSKVYYKGNGVITSLNLKDAAKVVQLN